MRISSEVALLVGQIKDLSPCPASLSELFKVEQVPSEAANQLEIIFKDEGDLEQHVLHCVNSRVYDLQHNISRVSQAVIYLGLPEMISLTTMSAVMQAFPGIGCTHYDRMLYWKDALGCALMARLIARHSGIVSEQDAFVSGFLQGIGKLVWDQYFPDDFSKILHRSSVTQSLLIDAEQELMGVTHDQLGAWFLQEWNCPRRWVEAVARADSDLTHVVHVADILTRALSLGDAGDLKIPVLSEESWSICQMDVIALEALLENVPEQWERLQRFILQVTPA